MIDCLQLCVTISGQKADIIRSLVQDGKTYEKICSTLELDMVDVLEATFTDVDGSETQSLDSEEYKPWTSQNVAVELYVNQQMRFTDISQVLDCHPETVKHWFTKLANPTVTKLHLDITDDFTISLESQHSDSLDTEIDSLNHELFSDDNVQMEESEDGAKCVTVARIHSSSSDMIEDGAPILSFDDEDWAIFPVGYEFAGSDVGRTDKSTSRMGIRELHRKLG